MFQVRGLRVVGLLDIRPAQAKNTCKNNPCLEHADMEYRNPKPLNRKHRQTVFDYINPLQTPLRKPLKDAQNSIGNY